jgi:hypothetical protein
MTTPEKTVVTFTISEAEANHLSVAEGSNFCYEDVDRFEVLGFRDPDKNPLHPDFTDGTMFKCESITAALLLRDFERTSGFDANLLNDMAAELGDNLIVESTRPWKLHQINPDDVRSLSLFVEEVGLEFSG